MHHMRSSVLQEILKINGIQAVNIALAEKYNYEKCSYDKYIYTVKFDVTDIQFIRTSLKLELFFRIKSHILK